MGSSPGACNMEMQTRPSAKTGKKCRVQAFNRNCVLKVPRFHTVRVEHVAGELHLRRTEWIVGREHQFGGENAALEAGSFGTPRNTHIDPIIGTSGIGHGEGILLRDQGLPLEKVVLAYGTSHNALRRI